METALKLKCPNCAESFLPTEAIWNELRSSIQGELHDELAAQQLELQEEKDEVHRLAFKLSAEKKELEETLASRLKDREGTLRDAIVQQLNSEKQEELQLLEDELAKKSKTIAGLNKEKREMLVLQRQLEEKEAEIELRYEQRLSDELNRLKTDARAQANEENSLVIRQKEKIISDLKQQLESARSKVDSYSAQLLGESMEGQLEEVLKTQFPQDKVIPIPLGVNGADTVMEIMVAGTCVAKLLFEVKNVKTFNRKVWLPKLHEDNRGIGAQALLLVVRNMPKELENEKFGILDGVIITTMAHIKPTVALLRFSALKIAQVTQAYKGKDSTQSRLFEYLTSEEFGTLSQSVLNQLDALKANFDAEKKKVVKLWSEREKMLEITILSVAEMYSKMRVVAPEIRELESLEIRLPKAG
jgi:hypothetical protein